MKYVYSHRDWVHGLWLASLRASLNDGCWLMRPMTHIKTREGVSDNLIVVVNTGMDDSRRLGW
jgi:hypothetical protein